MVLSFGNAHCGIQLEPPSLSLTSYLWPSAPGTVFFLEGRGPSEVRKEKKVLPPSKAFLRTVLPASHPHIVPAHTQIYRPTHAIMHTPVGGEVTGG